MSRCYSGPPPKRQRQEGSANAGGALASPAPEGSAALSLLRAARRSSDSDDASDAPSAGPSAGGALVAEAEVDMASGHGAGDAGGGRDSPILAPACDAATAPVAGQAEAAPVPWPGPQFLGDGGAQGRGPADGNADPGPASCQLDTGEAGRHGPPQGQAQQGQQTGEQQAEQAGGQGPGRRGRGPGPSKGGGKGAFPWLRAAEDEAELEMVLDHARVLTAEEVLQRRLRHLDRLQSLYREHYWALQEELRSAYRTFFIFRGRSGWRHEAGAVAAASASASASSEPVRPRRHKQLHPQQHRPRGPALPAPARQGPQGESGRAGAEGGGGREQEQREEGEEVEQGHGKQEAPGLGPPAPCRVGAPSTRARSSSRRSRRAPQAPGPGPRPGERSLAVPGAGPGHDAVEGPLGPLGGEAQVAAAGRERGYRHGLRPGTGAPWEPHAPDKPANATLHCAALPGPCLAKPLHLSVFCLGHILMDPKQQLYRACQSALPPTPRLQGRPLPESSSPSKGQGRASPAPPVRCGRPALAFRAPPFCDFHAHKHRRLQQEHAAPQGGIQDAHSPLPALQATLSAQEQSGLQGSGAPMALPLPGGEDECDSDESRRFPGGAPQGPECDSNESRRFPGGAPKSPLLRPGEREGGLAGPLGQPPLGVGSPLWQVGPWGAGGQEVGAMDEQGLPGALPWAAPEGDFPFPDGWQEGGRYGAARSPAGVGGAGSLPQGAMRAPQGSPSQLLPEGLGSAESSRESAWAGQSRTAGRGSGVGGTDEAMGASRAGPLARAEAPQLAPADKPISGLQESLLSALGGQGRLEVASAVDASVLHRAPPGASYPGVAAFSEDLPRAASTSDAAARLESSCSRTHARAPLRLRAAPGPVRSTVLGSAQARPGSTGGGAGEGSRGCGAGAGGGTWVTHEVCLADGDPPLAPLSAALAAAASPVLLPAGSPGLAGSSPGYQQHHGVDAGLLTMRLDAAELQRGSLPAGALEDRVLKRRKADKGPQPPALLAQAGALVLAQGAEAGGAVGAGALGARALNSPLALPRAPTAAGAAALSVLIPPSSDASGRLVEELRQFGQPQKKPGGALAASPGFGPKGASAGASAPAGASAGGPGAGPGPVMKQRQQLGTGLRGSSSGGVPARPPMVHHFGASGEYHPIPAALLNGAKEVSVLAPPLPAPVPPPAAAMPPGSSEDGSAGDRGGQGMRAGKGGAPGAPGAGAGLPPRRLPKGVPISSPLLAGLTRPGLAAAPRSTLSSPPISSPAARGGGAARRVPVSGDPPSAGRSAGGGGALGTPSDLEGGPHLPAADGPPPASSTWPYAPTSYLGSQAPGSGTAYSSFNGGAARPPSALGPAAPGAGSQAWPYAEATLVGTSTPMDAPKPTPTATAQGPP